MADGEMMLNPRRSQLGAKRQAAPKGKDEVNAGLIAILARDAQASRYNRS